MEENSFYLNEDILLNENDSFFNIVNSIFKDDTLLMENNEMLCNLKENEKQNFKPKNIIKTHKEVIREKERNKRRKERYHLKYFKKKKCY